MAVKLFAAGDLCPGDHYFSLGHGTGSRLARGATPFRRLEPLLREADLRIINLEGPLSATSSNAPGPEADVFRGPPAAVAALKEARIDLAHVANNHVLQHGEAAFRSTINLLEREGVTPIGVAINGSLQPVIKRVNGLRLGFLGFSFVPEKYLPGQHLYSEASLPSVLAGIRVLKTRVDLVIVSVHWGREATALPTRDVIEAGHAMIDAGASLILGHHPHWFQPIQRIGKALIAYSLGDFLFDLFWDPRLVESAILSVDLDIDGVVDYRLIPVRLDRDYQLRTRSDAEARRFLAMLARSERQLSNAASEQVSTAASGSDKLRKLVYFLSVFHRGDTSLKARFVLAKIASAVRRAFRGGQEDR